MEVKKWLVDNDKLDLTQDELETVLFNSMRARGFGDEYIQRYRMMNAFQQQKRPLIILICGSASTGKSTLAQQLASRLNLPNVLQIDALRDLLQGGEGAPLPETPLYMRHELDSDTLVDAYKQECQVMRRALEGDLVKCICDGKSIIIEGLHLDPGLYIREFGKGGALEKRALEQQRAAEEEGQKAMARIGAGVNGLSKIEENGISKEDRNGINEDYKEQQEENRHATMNTDAKELASRGGEATTVPAKAAAVPCRSKSIDEGLRTYGRPVFVPIVLQIDPEEYPVMAEEWLKRQLPANLASEAGAERERTLEQLIALQEYLSSYADSGVPVMATGILKYQQTLDSLHDHVLECVQESFRIAADEEK